MSKGLERTERELEARGEVGLRLEVVRMARVFKRSWVDLAQLLVQVRSEGIYRAWGYDDFQRYYVGELQLKQATVDKLTGSYHALERHAPEVFARDGLAQPMPTVDAVDYFARALAGDGERGGRGREAPREAPSDEVVTELKRAVFEDHLPVTALRKRFDPVLRPKRDEDVRLEHLQKTSAAVRKLLQLLEGLDAIDDDRRRALSADLEELSRELDRAAPGLARAVS